MDLSLPTGGLENYKSASQRARITSEAWGESNLFCANCESPELIRTRTNTPAIDFTCPHCTAPFQLKSQKHKLGSSLSDGAYNKMAETIAADKPPNLFALHYDSESWTVQNLVLVPRFSYSLSIVRKRNPLSPQAERHDWVGCTIMLGEIPEQAKIHVISNSVVMAADEVRQQYRQIRKLGRLSVEARGWTLDVLRVIQGLGKPQFSLGEVYQFESVLSRLHPTNRHVRPKIRQQLQILRDWGFVEFLGRGKFRMHEDDRYKNGHP